MQVHKAFTRNRSGRLLISSPNHPGKLLHLHILPNDRALRLILLVQRNLDNCSLNLPSTYTLHKLIERLTLQSQP